MQLNYLLLPFLKSCVLGYGGLIGAELTYEQELTCQNLNDRNFCLQFPVYVEVDGISNIYLSKEPFELKVNRWQDHVDFCTSLDFGSCI